MFSSLSYYIYFFLLKDKPKLVVDHFWLELHKTSLGGLGGLAATFPDFCKYFSNECGMNYQHTQLRISKVRHIRLPIVKFFVFIPGDVGDTVRLQKICRFLKFCNNEELGCGMRSWRSIMCSPFKKSAIRLFI